MSVRLPRRSLDTDLPPAALGLGSTVVALVGVSLWAAVVARVFGAVPNLPRPLVTVSAATSLVGLAGGGVAYARLRGFDVGLGAPRAGSWPTAVAAAVGPDRKSVV